MSNSAHRIDKFMNGPGGRADDWRDLVEAAKAWAGGRGDRGKYQALLNDLAVTEEFHGYPGLKKYSHLVGNFGGAWQDQAKEFATFPGAIIFNTNCIQRPAETYKDRLFTWGLVQWPD